MKRFLFFISTLTLLTLTMSAQEVQASETIYSINADIQNDSIILTWKTNQLNQNLLIYRSTSPFTDLSSLAEAVLIANFYDGGTPYVDHPVAGIEYYYAVISESNVSSGKIQFKKGINTLANSVSVQSPKSKNAELENTRPISLPYLNPDQKHEEEKYAFSDSTENIILQMTTETQKYEDFLEKTENNSSYIFPDEQQDNAIGENLILQKIVKRNYYSNDNSKWTKLENELKNFMQIRRTPKVTARASFYLGECYFYQGKYDQALLEFFDAEEEYPEKANEWIQYSLKKLSKLTE